MSIDMPGDVLKLHKNLECRLKHIHLEDCDVVPMKVLMAKLNVNMVHNDKL